jgi:hypothetical protein
LQYRQADPVLKRAVQAHLQDGAHRASQRFAKSWNAEPTPQAPHAPCDEKHQTPDGAAVAAILARFGST